MNIYYVYVYLDTRKPGEYIYGDYSFEYEPIYVGKGKGSRSIRHLKGDNHNIIKINKINKIIREGFEPKIIKVVEDVTNEEALNKEIELIKLIGRYCKEEGPLTNVKPGGEDSIGYKHTNDYIEQLQKPVVKYNLTGKVLEEYISVQEAGLKNKTHPQTISQICGGGIKIWKDKFIFMYKGEKFKKRERGSASIGVYSIDYNGDKKYYKSLTEASEKTSSSLSKIMLVCKGNRFQTNGLLFRYENINKYNKKIKEKYGKYLNVLDKKVIWNNKPYKNALEVINEESNVKINNIYYKLKMWEMV
jgi:hypothetical protein